MSHEALLAFNGQRRRGWLAGLFLPALSCKKQGVLVAVRKWVADSGQRERPIDKAAPLRSCRLDYSLLFYDGWFEGFEIKKNGNKQMISQVITGLAERESKTAAKRAADQFREPYARYNLQLGTAWKAH